MPHQILITGSNRGVGLALVKEFLSRGNSHIFATCRNPQSATDLQAVQKSQPDAVTIIQLDVNNQADINNAVETVSAKTSHLDLLINNAGIYPKDAANVSFGQLEQSSLEHVLNTNSIAPVMITQAFAPFLKKAQNAKVVMISSQMGSITRAGSSGFSYRMSKAALNMATKVLSQTLHGTTVITTHPGHVATDMGGMGAPVSPTQSAKGLADIISNLSRTDNGNFYNYNGEEIPW